MLLARTQPDGLRERPRAVGVQRDACPGKALGERGCRLHLLHAAQHAALQLEVVEPVTRACCVGQAQNAVRGQRLFMPQAQPQVGSIGLTAVGKVRLLPVADVEQIAEHLHAGSLLSFAQQRGYWLRHVLAQQIQQRRLNGRDRVNRRPLVEGLHAATLVRVIWRAAAYVLQNRLMRADLTANDQLTGVFQQLQSSPHREPRRRRCGLHCPSARQGCA